MATTTTLDKLLIKELKRELRDRSLKTIENKETVQAEADPDTYLFEVEPDMEFMQQQMAAVLENIGSMREQLNSGLRNTIDKLDVVDTKIDIMESGIKTELLAMNQRVQAVEERITNVDKQMKQRVDADEMKIQAQCMHRNVPDADMTSFVPEVSKKMKAPVFDGSLSWSMYKKQFDAAAKVNKWNSEEEKATSLVLSLRGKASELLQSLPNQQDFAALVQAMELR
ncbi:uncharacterized protein LOC129926588 [Biomphalaria glabrata]|uniref:Uncharacterized protein LOC129926588 n=1 Tax=Biomphalaria glabrata TaxID=6526 RepID=A0A9W3AJZ6_BIOGL|nr:uncharacterized protein LOC129926588 [Biomphalaria glabrata]